MSAPTADDIFGPEARVGNRRVLDRLPGGGYAYRFVDDLVRIEFRHLRRESRQLHAEVDVQCEWPGVRTHRGSLSCADLNLSSQTARKGLGRYCLERSRLKADEFDFVGAIDAACIEVIRAERQGDDVIVLDDAPDTAEQNFDVAGLTIPADAASMLIAHGDSLKSIITLYVLGTLAQRGHRGLYLDWEWTAARHKARKTRLFGAERLDNLRYLKCHAPLVVEADRVRRYCDEHAITFVAVDSVGLACDGKLIDDDVAIRFHRALAGLPPALCAAHVPKSSLGPDGKGDAIGPFGSVFFSNLCRASWLVKKQAGGSEDVVHVGLFPQKQNDGARQSAVGLQFTFEGTGRIHVRPADLATVEGLADRLPLWQRVQAAVRAQPQTLVALAEHTGAKVDTIDRTVRRKRELFTRITGPDGIHCIALVERRVS